MDSPEDQTGKPSPRRELQLQGPRPTPLKVRKDSYKIRKPPVVPHPSQPPQQPPQPRQPNIIYTVSPKVIHIDASNFMTVVQRLTGSSSSSSSSPTLESTVSLSSPYGDRSGEISPAARLATIEKTSPPKGEKGRRTGESGFMEDTVMADMVDRSTGLLPGILSPLPSALPHISPNFFSPTPDPNSFSFLHDLSPAFHGNRSFIEGVFMSSPSAFFSAPITSPTPSLDLFNQFMDF